jgi:hypothetical protein
MTNESESSPSGCWTGATSLPAGGEERADLQLEVMAGRIKLDRLWKPWADDLWGDGGLCVFIFLLLLPWSGFAMRL